MPRTASKAARSKTKASVPDSATVVSGGLDDSATDDSVTLVDDADDSITALDFDIPISSRRTSGVSNNKRKRRASVTTPAIKRARRQQQTGNNNNNEPNNTSIIHILPLRTQILDDHIKRRIRRNGLSAEMNSAYGEKRERRQKTLAELRRARDELRDRDAEIERLRELTALFDQHGAGEHSQLHVQELETELSRLRGQVMGRRRGDGHHDDDLLLTSSPPVAMEDDDDGWGAMGGMSDGGSDAGGDFGHGFDDDEEFGESSLAELESGGTPGQHRQQQQKQHTGKRPTALHLHGPTLTPPSTSPAKLPSSPVRQIHSSSSSSTAAETRTCDTGVQAAALGVSADASSQACIPDPGVGALQDELSTLRAEVTSLNDTLLERDALRARVGEKLAQHHEAKDDQDVELQLDIVLQDLEEKTARLGELSSLLMPSSPTDSTTDKEATAQLASALQSVREALADLDADNTPIPQTAVPLLSLTATRLRELDTSLKQREADHDATLATLNQDLAAARATATEKATAATNLSLDVAHLAETITALREELDILQSTTTSQAADLDSARDAALQQKTAAAEAEARLAEAVERIAALSKQLSELEASLRDRDGEVDRVKGELAEAGVTIAKLREGNAREMGRSREVVRAMRAQMVAALQMGEGFLGDGVAKEEEGVDVGGLDKAARGRSDDSGLGLDGELSLV